MFVTLSVLVCVIFSRVLCTLPIVDDIDDYGGIWLPTEPSPWTPVTNQGGCDVNCTIRPHLPCVVEKTPSGNCPLLVNNSGIDFPSKPTDFRASLHFKEANNQWEPYLDIMWKPPSNALRSLTGFQMKLFHQFGAYRESQCVRLDLSLAQWTEYDFDNRQQLQYNYSCHGPLKVNSANARSYKLQVGLYSLPTPRLTENTPEDIISRTFYVPPPYPVIESIAAYMWKSSPLIKVYEQSGELEISFELAPSEYNFRKYTITVHEYHTQQAVDLTPVDIDVSGKQIGRRSFHYLCKGEYYITVEPKAMIDETCVCPTEDGGCKCSEVRAPYGDDEFFMVQETYQADGTCLTTKPTTTKRSVSSSASTTDLIDTSSLPTSVIDSSSTQRPLTTSTPDTYLGGSTDDRLGGGQVAGIVVGVIGGIAAALIVVFMIRRRKNKMPDVVILSSVDNDPHIQVVNSLASLISGAFTCNVICNVRDHMNSSLDQILNEASAIVIVVSEGVFHRYTASKKGQVCRFVNNKQEVLDSLVPALSFVKQNLFSDDNFASKVVLVKFPHSSDNCFNLDFRVARLSLLDDIEKLMRFIPAKEQNGADQDRQNTEAYNILVTAMQDALEYHKREITWFTEKFYQAPEGCDVTIEAISPDIMSVTSGITLNTCTDGTTVCEMSL